MRGEAPAGDIHLDCSVVLGMVEPSEGQVAMTAAPAVKSEGASGLHAKGCLLSKLADALQLKHICFSERPRLSREQAPPERGPEVRAAARALRRRLPHALLRRKHAWPQRTPRPPTSFTPAHDNDGDWLRAGHGAPTARAGRRRAGGQGLNSRARVQMEILDRERGRAVPASATHRATRQTACARVSIDPMRAPSTPALRASCADQMLQVNTRNSAGHERLTVLRKRTPPPVAVPALVSAH